MSESSLDSRPGAAVKEGDSGARRHRLREFQAQLVERMQAASSGTHTQASKLGVLIGETRWLLNLQEAGEIVSVGAVTPVPLTKDWFLGLVNVRGNLISVIDLGCFRGMAATRIEKDSRVIAFAPSLSFNCGLLVSRVMGLRNVADMEMQPQPSSADTPWITQRYLDRDSHVWNELNLSLIVQDPQFLQVGV